MPLSSELMDDSGPKFRGYLRKSAPTFTKHTGQNSANNVLLTQESVESPMQMQIASPLITFGDTHSPDDNSADQKYQQLMVYQDEEDSGSVIKDQS